ncbi:FHA domain-containing protein [Massilia sp. TWR1-2-2]|uniref:FHA domain-containing protein n=1 Tax=Massilia sp. TWR1-2-2 TaxID=2804584 RepID=UPI003CEE0AC1
MAKIIISRDAKAVQEVELGAGQTTIGRHPQNDVVIGHQAVSSRHAAVTSIDGMATIEDLDSSNGTFVNGLRIGRKVLSDGDRVTIGDVRIDYMANGAPVAPALASIEVLNGVSTGRVLILSKPLTTLGSPGVLVVVISRQADGYFVAQVQGVAAAQVNGVPVGRTPRRLADGDELELTGTRMRFAAQSG